jgi:hypothetical protein
MKSRLSYDDNSGVYEISTRNKFDDVAAQIHSMLGD